MRALEMRCKKAANLTHLSIECNSLTHPACKNNLSAERKIPALLTAKITQLAEFGNRLSGLSLLPVALLLRQGRESPSVCRPGAGPCSCS